MQITRAAYSKYYLAASVALTTFLAYLSSFHHAFVDLDDPLYVVENPHIRSLNGAFFKWAFFDFYAANWHPLTWISHAVDYAIWGLDASGHHLTNILLHSVNAFLVVLLIIKIMELSRETSGENPQSGFFNTRAIFTTAGVTGLLFGLHPLHVESVAWVSERKDLLCALFFLLSIMRYADHVRSVRAETSPEHPFSWLFYKHYALALGFFILALLSKPMAVTLPVALLILDWYPFNRIRSWRTFLSAFVEKLPFIAFSLISSILTVLAQRSGGALQSLDYIPLDSRFLVGARALVLYLWKMIWPLNLMPQYPYPINISVLSPEYYLPIAFLVAITIGCLIMAKKQSIWLSAWSFFVVTLVPVIGIVQVGGQPMADRYTYLPGLSPFVIVGLAAAAAWENAYTLSRWAPGIKLFAAAMAVLVLSAMFYFTLQQITIWENGLGLWNYMIDQKCAPPLAYYNRGIAFSKSGRFDRALADNNMAIAMNPSYVEAYSNRGQVFDQLGQLDRAISDYDKALALNPNYFQAYYNRGIAYIKTHQFEKAIEDFSRTIDMNPSFTDSYNNRATAFFLSGRIDKALADLNTIIALTPNYQAYYNRGLIYRKLGQPDKAANDFNEAKALQPH